MLVVKLCELCGVEIPQVGYRLRYPNMFRKQRFCSYVCARQRPAKSARYLHRGGKKLHRVLMEQHLGRSLAEGEVVHHINGNKHDNRIENLQVMSDREHKVLHTQIKPPEDRECPICGTIFKLPYWMRAKQTCGRDCGVKLKKFRAAEQKRLVCL